MLRIDWTGERFVHGAGDAQLWYEHAHRYALAVGLAEGRRVVDVGCGEGYGAAWLASRARSVIGVDVAPEAIAHARSSYQAAGLSFAVGDARQMDLPDGSADLVTCFETIEHVSNPGAVLDELARILAPAGILLVSTPDAAESDGQNPFHLHELTVAELARELDGRFTHRLMFGQRVSAASHLWPLDDRERFGTAAAAVLSGNGAVPRLTGAQQRAVYVVAVCSQQPLDDVPMAGPATLVDAGDELLTDLRGQLDRVRGQLQADESELDARATALAAADDAAARARDQLRSYESELTSRARSLADADRDLAGPASGWPTWTTREPSSAKPAPLFRRPSASATRPRGPPPSRRPRPRPGHGPCSRTPCAGSVPCLPPSATCGRRRRNLRCSVSPSRAGCWTATAARWSGCSRGRLDGGASTGRRTAWYGAPWAPAAPPVGIRRGPPAGCPPQRRSCAPPAPRPSPTKGDPWCRS